MAKLSAVQLTLFFNKLTLFEVESAERQDIEVERGV